MSDGDDRIRAALENTATTVKAAGARRWLCVLENGFAIPAQVRATGPWLDLRVSLSQARSYDATAERTIPSVDEIRERAPALLRWNAQLHGLAKFALPLGSGDVELRADLPLDADVDLPWRLREAWAGICEGIALVRGEAYADHLGTAELGRAALDYDLPALGGETAWPFTARSSHRLAFELDVPGQALEALVEAAGGDEPMVRVSTALEVDARQLTPLTRMALATWLLEASADLRMIRAATDADGSAPRLECTFGDAITAVELMHALRALSTACARCATEATVLERSETVAARFLTLRRPRPTSAPARPGAAQPAAQEDHT